MAEDRGSHLEELNIKTKAELLEILERQSKLLNNKQLFWRGFINKLEDKGEKIRKAVEVLNNLILKKQKEEITVDSFGKFKIKNNKNFDSDDEDVEEDGMKDPYVFTTLATNGFPAKNSARNGNEADIDESISDISTAFDKISIVASDSKLTKNLKMDYDYKITEKLNQLEKLPKRETFKPFKPKNVNIKKHSDECDKYKFCQEISALYFPSGSYESAKSISLEESLQLQKQQTEKQKELQIKHAAEKLAERMNITTEFYEPEPDTDLSYRESHTEFQESDDADD